MSHPRMHLDAPPSRLWIGAALLHASVMGLMLTLGSTSATHAQGGRYVVGRVVDDSSGVAIEHAELVLLTKGFGATAARAWSDVDGRFILSVPAQGGTAVRVRRIGYEPTLLGIDEATARGERGLVVRMVPRATSVPGVTTTAQPRSRSVMLEGFEARRKFGVGTFFTREQLEERGWPSIPNLLRGVPGIIVAESGRRSGVSMARSAQARRCQPVLFLDGVRLNSSADSPESVRRLYDMIPGTDLTAVEIYKGRSELPADFGGPEVECGAIVAWTKRPEEELRRLRRP